MRLLTIYNALSLLALVPHSVYASVLAIDYGADWIKASVMSPGIPFDVLLNKDSKRKIQSSVGWKRTDRVFGSDAFNLASRFPEDSFSSLKYLEAAPFKSDIVSYYGKISSAEVVETSRGTVGLKRSDGEEWSVEELIAMQFSYVKHLAEAAIGEKVQDVIVTVPPFFTQFERDAVVDAIEISGLRTLALINDGTAVAINYAMTKSFAEAPEYHIVYDAGASAIRATVVAFSSITDPKTKAPTTQITVNGVGYDRGVGGIEMDRRLREILIDRFITKHKRDIRKEKKAMAKLWKEAGRVKAILSANIEATATIESLAWDIDFKTKITRNEYEAACGDFRDRFTRPIYDALVSAGLTLNDISSVILTGGATRTPMLQASVRAFVGEDKISLNVNADEAAVLGAAFHGASLSRQFKTKTMKLTDINLYDVQVSYLATSTTPLSRPRAITTLVFPSGSKTGTKKTLTFRRKDDFTVSLEYKNLIAPGLPQRMLEAELVGVAEAIGNLTEQGVTDPVIKASLSLSESGFISVSNAMAYGETKDESITGKLKSIFVGGSSSSEGETETQSLENEPPRETESSNDASSEEPVATPKAEAKPREVTINLTVNNHFTTIAPMTVEEKRAARNRLRAVDVEEAAKTRKGEARNTLESYLYRLRDLVNEENDETPFKKCSTPKERQSISEKLDQSFLWLHDMGDVAETSQFLDKRIALETLEKPIIHRYTEIEAFPQALNSSQMWNWSTRLFLSEARANLTAEAEAGLPSKWTKEELDALEKTLKEHESWLGEWVEKQKKVKTWENPVIETTEMKARAKVLETQLQKLWKRKVPKTKKPKTSMPPPTPSESVEPEGEPVAEPGDDSQVPLGGKPHDEL